jgi:predicted nucleic acid-binding protein
MATVACFDTSVLVKRYVEEAGSRVARDLLRRFRPVCSAIIQVEVASAISRRERAGEISAKAARTTLNRLGEDRARWELIDVEAPVLARAEQLVREVRVATLDAIHIASALVFIGSLRRDVPFVTADANQRAAAERANLEVVWVE